MWESPLAVLITGPQCTHLQHGLNHRPTRFLGLLREAKEGASERELDKSQYIGQILRGECSFWKDSQMDGF